MSGGAARPGASVARPLLAALLAALLLSGLIGCRSKGKVDPILSLSAEEALATGKQLLADEKYSRAVKYLAQAFEASPNSAEGREALLLQADALFHDGGGTNLIRAEAKYRDYLNRFPTSEQIPYVQFQIGNSLAARVERPDRDQSITIDALAAYEELLRLFPESEEARAARERIAELEERLAEHEMMVAMFYLRYRLSAATIGRLEYLLERYPSYSALDKVYYYLGVAHGRRGNTEEAEAWFQRLREDYPQSEWIAEIPETPPGGEEPESSEASSPSSS